MTGGVMSSRLSDIDRDMKVFKGAVISAGHAEAAVGEDRGLAAARHAKETYGTDVGVAVVLPDPSEGARRGTVYLGIVLGNQEYTEHVALPGDHNRLRNYAVISVMNFLRRLLS
ncbi:MAG: CinA family protein, partial [Pseudomonadota bacterium]|nr:CinA family protein [Pseudomonadota bacterium]